MATTVGTKGIIALAVMAALAAGPASAAGKAGSEETTGVGVGAVVGAVAGGPVGLVVGAAAGAWLGDRFHDKNQQVDSLSASLETSESARSGLERKVSRLQGDQQQTDAELARLRAIAKPELLSLLQTGIEMDLLFRTDESVLTDATSTRLQQLASTLSGMPEVRVQLDGFADERGDATYNQGLSTRRADHVRDILVTAGVAPERIKVAAHGESPAPDSNVDSYALQRRVSLTLYVDNGTAVASNPN